MPCGGRTYVKFSSWSSALQGHGWVKQVVRLCLGDFPWNVVLPYVYRQGRVCLAPRHCLSAYYMLALCSVLGAPWLAKQTWSLPWSICLMGRQR